MLFISLFRCSSFYTKDFYTLIVDFVFKRRRCRSLIGYNPPTLKEIQDKHYTRLLNDYWSSQASYRWKPFGEISSKYVGIQNYEVEFASSRTSTKVVTLVEDKVVKAV